MNNDDELGWNVVANFCALWNAFWCRRSRCKWEQNSTIAEIMFSINFRQKIGNERVEVGKHSDYLRNLEFHAYFPILTRSLIYILNVRTRFATRTSVFTSNTLPPHARQLCDRNCLQPHWQILVWVPRWLCTNDVFVIINNKARRHLIFLWSERRKKFSFSARYPSV